MVGWIVDSVLVLKDCLSVCVVAGLSSVFVCLGVSSMLILHVVLVA